MNLFNAHTAGSHDPLLRPTFGWQNKLLRLVWAFAWALLFRTTPAPFHRWRCGLLRLFGARLGAMNFIYPSARIWAPWLLETGDVVTIAGDVEVYNPGGVSLGDRTIISQGAYLCGATHDYQSAEFTYLARLIKTEAQVWICARAIVLPGICCREGSVLGAGSVATRTLEEWTVYAGNPAVAVRQRNRHETPAQSESLRKV